MAGAVVNVAGGGLVVYGTVIGGILGTLAFIHRYKLPSLAMFDLAIPSLMLGMGLGRLGCLMNGCCFGSLCSLPWAVTFPPGSPPHFYQFQHSQLALQGIRVYGWPGTLAWITDVEPGSAAAKAGLAERLRQLAAEKGKPRIVPGFGSTPSAIRRTRSTRSTRFTSISATRTSRQRRSPCGSNRAGW